ncbi:MAG: phage major capsid protein [Ferrovibrio sp.]|uniref:phage major capsid protein n=1 Tax=Ferrovibrio sp. TaxID=1917215 RepID=UPI00261BD226|nr:phage major capsid protein [Ferrovibrio sp.]MCW0235271.1 phage major capsid protein [Ferrovibrio sp.]
MATIDDIAKDINKFGDDFKALRDDTQRDLKALRDELDAAGKKLDPIVSEKVNKISEAVDVKHDVLQNGIKALTEQVEKIDAVLKRPGANGGWAGDEAAAEAKAAFDFAKARLIAEGKLGVNTKIEPDAEAYAAYAAAFPSYLRARTEAAMPRDFQAAMQTGSDPDGGYLVPTTVSSRIIKKVYETSNLRALATVETIGGKELEIPRDEGEFGYGGWVGETTAPSETTTSQLGVSKIFAHEMFAEPRVTQNMLEDAGLDIEAWVANKVGEKLGRIEATAFFTGTGVNQPRGLLTYGNGTANGTIEQVVSGGATSLTADAFYNLVFQLKDYYTQNARFLMKRTSVRDVMKLKDGHGNYLWQMGDIKGGQPATILGFPVDRCEDMPTVAASSLSVAFGDFRAAYTIVDRLGITLLRDNLTAKPYVKFYNRRRVGGDVVNFEAIKLMVTSA